MHEKIISNRTISVITVVATPHGRRRRCNSRSLIKCIKLTERLNKKPIFTFTIISLHAHISITNYTQSHLNHFTCITSPFICLWRHKITWQYCSVSGQYIKYQHRKTAHQIPAQDNKFVLIHPHSIFIYTNQNFQKEKKYWINKNIKSSAHQLKTVHKRQKHIIHNHAIKLPISWSSIFF